MKTVLLRMILPPLLFAGAALAQNSDLALLLGATGPISSSVTNAGVADSFGAGLQLNYAAQLHETQAGQLYLEVPLMIGAQVRDTVASNVASYVKASLFLTPGVRWRFTPQRRVSFYAAAGAGVGNFGSYLSYVGSGPGLSESVTGNTTSAAFDWGGGIDFRLTRLLSLRAEGRDFVTRAGLGGFAGRNHAFFMAGIGFHF